MFGYVRPLRSELKCRDFDLYRATYCGLCRCLRRRYGPIAPMFLNFDFTFLTLLLWQPEENFTPCRGRCHANLLVKKPMCPDDPALELAADECYPGLVEAEGLGQGRRFLRRYARPVIGVTALSRLPKGGQAPARLR